VSHLEYCANCPHSFVYCIKVYLQSMWSDDRTETHSSAGLPSYTNSVRTRSARAVYRRVSKVLWLQWRGILIVIFILVDVIFFSVVFIWLNALQSHARDNLDGVMPWLLCLMEHPDDPKPCFDKGQDLAINQSTVSAILIMLSIAGIQVFILLLRWSMITGWVELIRSRFSKNREFVSLDAKHYQDNSRNYELKKFEQEEANHLQYPQEAYRSPLGDEQYQTDTPDYFNKEVQRPYQSPEKSFSTPRPMSPPEQIGHPRMDWDPRSTHARGGLGLHPPEFESKF
jgi:hypothetical protein